MPKRSYLLSLQLTAGYAAVGMAWYLATHYLVAWADLDHVHPLAAELVQALLFVGATSLLLCYWSFQLRRRTERGRSAEAARTAAEQALAAEVERCRALLKVSVDGIHILDPTGQLVDANETFLAQRGYTRDDIPRLKITDWNHNVAPAELQRRMNTVGPKPTLYQTTHRRKDGSTFDVELVLVLIPLRDRRVICASARDITERKEMEQRLLRSQRLESVGLIASGIAHDLNNVLAPIVLSAGLLETRYPEDAGLVKTIEASARRGSSIVQQVLTFARGAEGQRICLEPKVLVKELTQLLRETFPRNIVHELDVAPDAWPICGDPTQLHQVLLNLAVNARDAMPHGGRLSICISNRELDAEVAGGSPGAHAGRYVCIAVTDTGTGMPPQVIDHLFEPFFTTKPRGRGTGLGLSTVHGLVRGHRGFVEVTSTLGAGSQFRVFLPAAVASETPVLFRTDGLRPPAGRGERVLIVDDEPTIVAVMATLLERHGFAALTAANGEEALAALERHPGIAVVITDVMMPKTDGVRLATELRARNLGVRVIAMSGLLAGAGEEDSRRQLLQLGVRAILHKPCSESELLKAIEAVLGPEAAEPRAA